MISWLSSDLQEQRAIDFESVMCQRHRTANADYSKLSAEAGLGGVAADCLPSPKRRQALQSRGVVKTQNWKDWAEAGPLGEVRFFEKRKKKKKKRRPLDFGLREEGDPDFCAMSLQQALAFLRVGRGGSGKKEVPVVDDEDSESEDDDVVETIADEEKRRFQERFKKIMAEPIRQFDQDLVIDETLLVPEVRKSRGGVGCSRGVTYPAHHGPEQQTWAIGYLTSAALG